MLQSKCIKCVQALSAKARFTIYQKLLSEGKPMTVGQLVKLTKLRQPTVSFHIQELVASGLVSRKKEGRQVLCAAHPECKDCPFTG